MIGAPLPELPAPSGFNTPPVWTGYGFRIGDALHPVLKYHVGDSGWTTELTTFHEDLGGENHYINIASREHALRQLGRISISTPTIIDIGCSSGFLLRSIRQRFPRAVVLGSDYVLDPLERLAAQLTGIPLLQFDLVKCPLPDESVDAAVLLNVLEHIEHDEIALRQVFRILKPGGLTVLEVPAGPKLYDIYDKQLMHLRRYELKAFVKLVGEAGFEILEQSHLGFFLYPAFWAVKKRQRRYLSETDEVQRALIANNIRSHADSPLLNMLMRLEACCRPAFNYPFGIRCLVVGQKPIAQSSTSPKLGSRP
jgi:ubiquinone/menaquinone biosynthesis C-methylase UbiE